MFKIKTLVGKLWVFVAAVVIIGGSASIMAFALDNNIPENASANAAPYTAVSKESGQVQAPETGITAEYTVVDLSKKAPDGKLRDEIKHKLSLAKDISPEQIEEKYNAIVANTIPGEKDISAEQAAAYAAGIVKKVYGVDLTGYTAEASFSRNPVPNADNWGVIFHAPKEDPSTRRYNASVDSVNGTMLDFGCYTLDFREEKDRDLENPEWKDKALQTISRLMPEDASIVGSKVVSAIPAGGVTVVCELSDGSAYAIRLSGENKEAAACQYFPDGYDGSWDYHPVTTEGVG